MCVLFLSLSLVRTERIAEGEPKYGHDMFCKYTRLTNNYPSLSKLWIKKVNKYATLVGQHL